MTEPRQCLPKLSDLLAKFPGRTNIMLRTLLASALVILISMTLQVPFLAISLIVVFYVTQANVVLTRLVGVMFVVGSTLGIIAAILLLKLTFDEPSLRILTAATLFTACVFLMRVTRISVAFFIIAIVVIYSQSFVDLTSQSELIVRLILWAWVAACYAVVITLIINTVLLPAEPVVQLKIEMLRLIGLSAKWLVQWSKENSSHTDGPEPHLAAATLLKLLRFATMRNVAYRQKEGIHLARIAAIVRLYADSRELSEHTCATIRQEAIDELLNAYDLLTTAITNDQTYNFVCPVDTMAGESTNTIIASIYQHLETLASLDSPHSSEPQLRKSEGVFLPDAFTNPVYVGFALKTTLATLISYVFYTGVQWDGVHTVMLTCLIVAQPGLGSTSRRGLLRITGAIVGSVFALLIVVFVVPYLDNIVGLLTIILPIIALSAWIAAGPEDISYGGTQLMFTYALALLGTFGPPTDLTEIRDRIIGIFFGVLISIFIHSTIAPETEGEPLRQKLSKLIFSLANFLRLPISPEPSKNAITSRYILGVWNDCNECELLLARVTLEPDWQLGSGDNEKLAIYTQTLLGQLNAILRTVSSLKNALATNRKYLPAGIQEAFHVQENNLAEMLEQYANTLIQHPIDTSSPRYLFFDAPAIPHDNSGNGNWNRSDMLWLVDKLSRQVAALPSWNDTHLAGRT